ncbi:MAG TPA: F0F1 ATP synthase subunit delta [Verrucomicrobia bacterium]|nr:F0F1 ATP synthase subunit delta [Verrucomicrobiota bacterium]HOP98800.1 F0F1 ATP synthase subunit delta [Verrucomicrobiota bacterium]HPU55504.1 F0F1 ATP synthase subunit delta [Verrucomicrobiota bacterium]
MKISKQARRDAKELFRSSFVNGVLDPDRVRQIVAKVAEAKPRGYVGILTHYHRLVKLELERRTAVVESAVPLGGDLRAGVTQQLTKLYGQGLSIAFAENPALLGGLRIKVGSDVYDGSVRARLNALQESFG